MTIDEHGFPARFQEMKKKYHAAFALLWFAPTVASPVFICIQKTIQLFTKNLCPDLDLHMKAVTFPKMPRRSFTPSSFDAC
jgi:hypothetical protein